MNVRAKYTFRPAMRKLADDAVNEETTMMIVKPQRIEYNFPSVETGVHEWMPVKLLAERKRLSESAFEKEGRLSNAVAWKSGDS